MRHYAWILEVRPGYEEEYKKRHDERNQILIGIACSGDSKQWGYNNHFRTIQFLIQKKFILEMLY